MNRAATLLLAAAFALTSAAQAQGSRWEREVRVQLDRALAAVRAPAGRVGRDGRILRVGPLNTAEADTVAVELRPGVTYDFIGVCDDDCARLEIVVSTASGSHVAVSRTGENLPVVRFTPPLGTAYRVTIVMAVCRMNPCWYGVAVQGR